MTSFKNNLLHLNGRWTRRWNMRATRQPPLLPYALVVNEHYTTPSALVYSAPLPPLQRRLFCRVHTTLPQHLGPVGRSTACLLFEGHGFWFRTVVQPLAASAKAAMPATYLPHTPPTPHRAHAPFLHVFVLPPHHTTPAPAHLLPTQFPQSTWPHAGSFSLGFPHLRTTRCPPPTPMVGLPTQCPALFPNCTFHFYPSCCTFLPPLDCATPAPMFIATLLFCLPCTMHSTRSHYTTFTHVYFLPPCPSCTIHPTHLTHTFVLLPYLCTHMHFTLYPLHTVEHCAQFWLLRVHLAPAHSTHFLPT